MLDLLFDDDARGAVVEQLAWRPGTEQVAGLWDDGDGKAWWLFDPEGGQTLLARPADFAVTGAGDVRELRWSADGRLLLVVAGGSFRLYDAESRRLVVLSGGSGKGSSIVRGEDPRLPPDSRRVAFVRDADLWLLDLETGGEKRLTRDGRPGVVINGATDWVYWEEIWGRSTAGHWWNGDGTRLAYYRFDDTDVPVYTLLDTRPLYPQLERQRYPKAGDALPRVEVRVFALASGETVRLPTEDDTGSDAYLARVHWHPDGEHVAVERLNRAQTRLDLLLCHAGDGSCRVVATQEQPTWVNLGDEFAFLADGRFLWSTEDSGCRQLYLYSADGAKRRRLTPRGWAVTSLDAVDEGAGRFVYTAHSTGRLGAAERHVFRGRLSGGRVRRLTEQPGWHGAAVSGAGFWVDSWSAADKAPRQTLRHLVRPQVARLLPRHPPSPEVRSLPRWQRLTLPGPGGVELPAQLLMPADLDPGRRYPALMYHYGCPGSQVVEDRWALERRRALWHRLMAGRGYAVLAVDNEGSPFFGKRGADRMHRRFGELELAAQLAGVDFLRGLGWVDASRIGLWGWSGGGAHTLYSVLRRPGVWKAAVAGAPVTDWRYYDAVWMERYLGRPRDNAEGYEASAPLTYAARLEDALLVIHGTADDNVHPQNTLNLVQAFVAAGVHFELALYPNARHSFESFGRAGQRHLFERMTAFFDRHLQHGLCSPISG